MVSNIANTLGNQLRWLVSDDRRGFTATAGVDLADVFDHTDLHRHDFQLLAGFFANGVLAAAASSSQLVLGQFVDDVDTGQVGGQRLTFATGFGRSYDFFLRLFGGRFSDTFGFIKKSQLRGRWIDCLFGFTPEETLMEQRILFFEMNNLGLHLSK